MKVATLLKSLGLYSLKVNSMFSFHAEGLNLVQVRIGPVGLVTILAQLNVGQQK